jgi:hypothetical protein
MTSLNNTINHSLYSEDDLKSTTTDKDIIDRYASLSKQKKEIESELKGLRDEIIRIRKLADSDNLPGNTSTVNVKISKALKFPLSDDPSRAGLEDLLKEAGKWPEVAVLNTARLSAQFKKGDWDPALRERVANYSVEEERASIRVL